MAETVIQYQGFIQRLENAEAPPYRVQSHVSDNGGDTILSLDFQRFLNEESKVMYPTMVEIQ